MCHPAIGTGELGGVCGATCHAWFDACRDGLFAVAEVGRSVLFTFIHCLSVPFHFSFPTFPFLCLSLARSLLSIRFTGRPAFAPACAPVQDGLQLAPCSASSVVCARLDAIVRDGRELCTRFHVPIAAATAASSTAVSSHDVSNPAAAAAADGSAESRGQQRRVPRGRLARGRRRGDEPAAAAAQRRQGRSVTAPADVSVDGKEVGGAGTVRAGQLEVSAEQDEEDEGGADEKEEAAEKDKESPLQEQLRQQPSLEQRKQADEEQEELEDCFDARATR